MDYRTRWALGIFIPLALGMTLIASVQKDDNIQVHYLILGITLLWISGLVTGYVLGRPLPKQRTEQ